MLWHTHIQRLYVMHRYSETMVIGYLMLSSAQCICFNLLQILEWMIKIMGFLPTIPLTYDNPEQIDEIFFIAIFIFASIVNRFLLCRLNKISAYALCLVWHTFDFTVFCWTKKISEINAVETMNKRLWNSKMVPKHLHITIIVWQSHKLIYSHFNR